jgi:hypothetical protein
MADEEKLSILVEGTPNLPRHMWELGVPRLLVEECSRFDFQQLKVYSSVLIKNSSNAHENSTGFVFAAYRTVY